MNKLWVMILTAVVLTGCNHSSPSSIAKPNAGHAASGASLSVEDGAWEDSVHAQTASAKRHSASRPVYPFSLVAGGAYSPADLARAMATSESLRAHYKNFDFKHVRLIRIQNNTPAFVSYRKDGKIFWTNRKLTVHAGELVLADGRYLVRARCANQISFVAQTPVDPTPSDVEARLDVPVMPTPIDYPRLREVSSPLLPPTQFAAPTAVLAKAYMPASAMPMLRIAPVSSGSNESPSPLPSSRPPVTGARPPHGAVPMPDSDGLTLAIIGLLLVASLFILKKQKKSV